MRRTQLWQWAGSGGACLAAAAAVLALGKGSDRPDLPVVVNYARLPELFNQTLTVTGERVHAHAGEAEEVRKLARLYLANRLFGEARDCFHVIAAIPPGLTACDHYYLADIAQNENDLAGTIAELRQVFRTEPGYVPARLALAEALFKSGEQDDAEKEYSALLAVEPNQPQASLGMARIELQKGEDDAAVSRLEDVMAGHPEFTSGAGLLAQLLQRRGETDRAVAMTQWSMQKPERPPADPWMDALLADCYDVQRLSLTFEEYFKIGRMEDAVPLLDRLAALDPKGPIAKIFAGFSHAQALQHITAVRDYYEALGRGGDPDKICPYLVQSLLALGKVTEATELMAEYCGKLPNSIPLAKAYADLVLRQGDVKTARVQLEKVLRQEPTLQPQNMSLAKILWDAGERDAAAVCLQRVAAVYANDVPSRALLGEYFLGKADPKSAIKFLEQASVYAPPKTPVGEQLAALLDTAYLQAGNGEAEQGHLAEAADCFAKAIRVAPSDLNGYAGRAGALVQMKQFRPAAEALEKLTSLEPDNPTIFLSLGDVRYQGGDPERARNDWQKALQLTAAGDAELRAALSDRLEGRITVETFK